MLPRRTVQKGGVGWSVATSVCSVGASCGAEASLESEVWRVLRLRLGIEFSTPFRPGVSALCVVGGAGATTSSSCGAATFICLGIIEVGINQIDHGCTIQRAVIKQGKTNGLTFLLMTLTTIASYASFVLEGPGRCWERQWAIVGKKMKRKLSTNGPTVAHAGTTLVVGRLMWVKPKWHASFLPMLP
ncbi:hypothetical protein V6N13_062539 [Hibiscus sabdariffa]